MKDILIRELEIKDVEEISAIYSGIIQKPVKPRRNPLIHVHLGYERYHSWKQFLDHAYWNVELK